MLTTLLVTLCLCFALFLLTIPVACWRAIRMNVRRLDGSLSTARLRREGSALVDYAMTLALPFVLIVPSVFVATLFVFNFIMPADLLARGFADFNFDRQVWKEKLHDEKADHAEFLQQQGLDAELTKQFQDVIWYGSPVIGLSAAVFAGVGFFWMLQCTGRSASKLGAGIRKRRSEYARRDVDRMQSTGGQQSAFSSPTDPITTAES